MIVQSFSPKSAHEPYMIQRREAAKTNCNILELFYGCLQGIFIKTTKYKKKIPHKKLKKLKLFHICYFSSNRM